MTSTRYCVGGISDRLQPVRSPSGVGHEPITLPSMSAQVGGAKTCTKDEGQDECV